MKATAPNSEQPLMKRNASHQHQAGAFLVRENLFSSQSTATCSYKNLTLNTGGKFIISIVIFHHWLV